MCRTVGVTCQIGGVTMLPTFTTHRLQYAFFWLPFGLATVGGVGSPVVVAEQQDVSPARIEGCWTGLPVCKALVREFNRTCGYMATKFLPRDSDQMAKCLAQRECDVGLVLHSLAPSVEKELGDSFEAFPLGQFAVGVVVNAKCPTRTVTTNDLGRIFRGEIASWADVERAGSLGGIDLYAPYLCMTECYILQQTVMHGGFAPQLRDLLSHSSRQRRSTEEVMGAVIKHPKAIGFFMLGPDTRLDNRVRLLRVADEKNSPAVALTAETIAVERYPIVDRLTFYLHPDAPKKAREFCEFATGPEGAKIIEQFGLWPEHGLGKVRGQQRLAEVKNGKGTEIVVCDLVRKEDVLNDLSLEFVKAKAAVQLKFQKGETRDTAIEKLAKGATDLLLADGKSGEVREERGERSANPKSVEKGTVPGTLRGEGQSPFPRSIELGRMAVGVIVHPENPLESLPLDEAKSIFCGEVKKWPAVRGAAAAMHVFGLKHTDPMTQLLKEKLVERGRSLKYNTQPDNEKVILAVARDPAAIGFVDMSQLPPNDKSVKLVPVFEGKSKSQISNPLSRTLTLYVSPNASQTAKDFADFLTPEHCKEVIAQYNLLPPLHAEEASRELAKAKPAREGPQIEHASANEPIPPLLDDPDAPQDQGRAKIKKLAAKPKPVIPAPEQPAPPKVTADAQPAPETESEPQPTQTHPGAPSLTDEQIVWLVGGIAGVVLLALGVGWLQAPHRKRKRR